MTSPQRVDRSIAGNRKGSSGHVLERREHPRPWKFNNAYADTSGNGNTLTGNGSPVFSLDVPTGSVLAGDNYVYGETNYANPHAPTAYFNGTGTRERLSPS